MDSESTGNLSSSSSSISSSSSFGHGGSHRGAHPPPQIPAPYKDFKIQRSLSTHAIDPDLDGFSDSESESSGSEMEFDAIITQLQTTSLEEQKKKKLQRKESKMKEVDLDHQTPSPAVILPFSPASTTVAEGPSPSTQSPSPSPLPGQPATQAQIDEKLGGKELIEYTKQQNELKYGKMFKITQSTEEEKKTSKSRKSLSLVNPIKYIIDHTGHDDKDKEKEKDKDKEDKEKGSSSSGENSDEDSPPPEPEEKIIPELVQLTEKENRAKYKSMIPIKKIDEEVLSITAIRLTGYDKRFEPTKYYVYHIEVSRGGQVTSIFRRYSQFHHLRVSLEKEFPNTKHPSFPPKILFGRSHIQQVSTARMKKLDEYLQGVFHLRESFAASPALQDFVRTTMEDIENETFNKKLQKSGIRFD